jgi:hypothetical protein
MLERKATRRRENDWFRRSICLVISTECTPPKLRASPRTINKASSRKWTEDFDEPLNINIQNRMNYYKSILKQLCCNR